jgi:hypothetical protein
MNKPTHRVWIPWTLLVGLVVASAFAAGLGAQQRSGDLHTSKPAPMAFAPLTGFGGYVSEGGSTTEIRAEWRVPAAVVAAGPGSAVTWIGAQGTGGTGPFIQLGSYSDVYQQGSRPAAASYGLFWSDTAKDFHGVEIIGLEHAGDLIRFEMIKNSAGWKLVVKNLSFGWSRSLEIHYGAGQTFTQGEWLQEDPAAGQVTATDVPYADTSIVSFQHLRLNGRGPHLKFADAQALSTVSGTYLVPTHVRHDAFSLLPASGAARQFLADAEKLDSSLYHSVILFLPGSHPSGRSQRVLVAEEAKSYGRFADQVTAQVWPVSDRALIRRFVQDDAILQRHLTQWMSSGGSSTELSRIFDKSALRGDDQRLRARLGLPPVQ